MAGITRYVLLTGSDLGDRNGQLHQAAELIGKHAGNIINRSRIHETEPWGFESTTRFLNQALLVETELDPEALLLALLDIEQSMGRARQSSQWASRSIDIDILCAENFTYVSDSLQIPHRYLHERIFALAPLCELVPKWVHPKADRTYEDILAQLVDSSKTAAIS